MVRVFGATRLQAPVDQIRRGPIDYLTLDYLAEVTMSILQKQRTRDPQAGSHARDFVDLIARVLPDLKDRRIRVIANAGGINPMGCRDAVLDVAARQNIPVKVGTVSGDDITDRLDLFLKRGIEQEHGHGQTSAAIRPQVERANVSTFPVAEALDGAEVVALDAWPTRARLSR